MQHIQCFIVNIGDYFNSGDEFGVFPHEYSEIVYVIYN